MALAAAKKTETNHVVGLLTGTLANGGYAAETPAVATASIIQESPNKTMPTHNWPENYKPIRRVKFTTAEQAIQLMKPQALDGSPIIFENAGIIDVEKWRSISYASDLLRGSNVLVKKSPNCKFRYYDMKKNAGNFQFRKPVEETSQSFDEFLQRSKQIFEEGSPERLYVQESLSGHSDMAEEFESWKWEVPIRISSACGWGLPDSNELFIGMKGAETPLHFDERENLFFQIRGSKEIAVFPFTDYPKLYPFPTTHPCDRQSMVGSPIEADLEAFPKFKSAYGQYTELKAGDLLYLPYGWWHWLRNLDNFAVSISFWSTTPSTDLSRGIPDKFTDHMLTRVRRNLESMIAESHGPERLNASMNKLRDAITHGEESSIILKQVRGLLAAVKMQPEDQDKFLLDTIEGRFNIDWNKHI